MHTWKDKLGTLWAVRPLARQYMKWCGVTVADFAGRLKNPFLREVFSNLSSDAPGSPILALIVPLIWERFTASWCGSYDGWLPNGKTMDMSMSVSKTLTGLESFYMTGESVNPDGGLPPCASSGPRLVQFICHRDGKQFVTTEP